MVKKLFLVLSLAFMSFEVVGQNEDEMVMVVETAPVYGGDLNSFITDNIYYPISAIKDSVEGTVYVEFYIDTVGGTFKHRVKLKISYAEIVDSTELNVLHST